MADDYPLSREDIVKIVMSHGEKLSSLETSVSIFDKTVTGINKSFDMLFKGYLPNWAALLMTCMGAALGYVSAIAFHH